MTKRLPNLKQRILRWFGLILLIGMGVCPPWQMTYTSGGEEASSFLGYHPIWSPPSDVYEVPEDVMEASHKVNLVRIGIQFAVVIIFMNAGNYALRTRNSISPKPEEIR